MRTPLLRPMSIDGRVVISRRKRDGALLNVDTDFALPSRITVLSADISSSLPITLSLRVPPRRTSQPSTLSSPRFKAATRGAEGGGVESASAEGIALDEFGEMALVLKHARER